MHYIPGESDDDLSVSSAPLDEILSSSTPLISPTESVKPGLEILAKFREKHLDLDIEKGQQEETRLREIKDTYWQIGGNMLNSLQSNGSNYEHVVSTSGGDVGNSGVDLTQLPSIPRDLRRPSEFLDEAGSKRGQNSPRKHIAESAVSTIADMRSSSEGYHDRESGFVYLESFQDQVKQLMRNRTLEMWRKAQYASNRYNHKQRRLMMQLRIVQKAENKATDLKVIYLSFC